jgi:hypothetical protein
MWVRAMMLVAGWSLALGWNACGAQNGGLSFWEPKSDTVTALTRAGNGRDNQRYQTLRRAFIESNCTTDRMSEETAAHDEKNLICVLPGLSSEVVMVEARYDRGANAEEGADWSDAMTLPLLFNALQAQPRKFTFVFAAIGGHEAEQRFLANKRDPASMAPVATIVLDGLGSGFPFCYSKKQTHPPAGSPDVCSNASAVSIAMHLPTQPPTGELSDSADQRVLRRRLFLIGDPLLTHDSENPGILIYSDLYLDQQTPLKMYSIDFDFVAWFLCRTDATLDPEVSKTIPQR